MVTPEASTRSDSERAHTLLRVEDARLLRGQGGFVANQRLPGMTHAVFVRSMHAHARLRSVDLAAAREQPGVLAVFGPKDFAGLVQPRVNALVPEMQLPRAALVPADRVLAVGAPLAIVVAQTAQQAQSAADLVWVDCEELALVADFALGAAPLYPPVADNLAIQVEFHIAELPAAPATAHAAITLPRVAASPLETRGALMHWNAQAQSLKAWLSTQTPARAREELAQALAVAPEQVQVIAIDVGGAFGGKASLFPEDLMLAVAARQLGQPVRWLATRGEDLLAGTHGRASQLHGALWMQPDGQIDGLKAQLQFALGHWLPFSAAAPLNNASRILPGPYRVPAWHVQAESRLGHAAAVGIYRGAGRPEACILMERLVDEAARHHGLDPLAVRLANVWAAEDLPRELPHGVWLDRCDLRALLERAAERFDYTARRARQHARRAQENEGPPLSLLSPSGGGQSMSSTGGRAQCTDALVGLGIALYVEPCGQGGESVRLNALPGGRYRLATGATAQGQGRETAYALLLARALGCAPEQIEVLHGDTARCPSGIGALASRSTAIGGSAVLAAAAQLKEKLAAGATLPCSVELFHTTPHEAWASGCVMLELHVDRATGRPHIESVVWVDDAGEVVSPELVHGQLIGGLAQGLGQALMERIVYDAQGQLLTGSLMDYAVPRAEDMPPVHLESLPTRSAANALGAKGVGEAGCIGLPAALLNAAHDALAPLGVRQLDFPLSAAALWRAMQRAQAQPASTESAAPFPEANPEARTP